MFKKTHDYCFRGRGVAGDNRHPEDFVHRPLRGACPNERRIDLVPEDLVPWRYTDVRKGLTPPVGGVPHRVRSEHGAAFGRAAAVPTRESPRRKRVHVGPQKEAKFEALIHHFNPSSVIPNPHTKSQDPSSHSTFRFQIP